MPVPSTYRPTHDPTEAEQIVGDLYLPHRLHLPPGVNDVQLELSAAHFGQVTAGVLGYGRAVGMTTEPLVDFHVDLPLRGTVVLDDGRGSRTVATPGHAGVFDPGAPASLDWSADSKQLCLMMPRSVVERELEWVLGRSLPTPLSFHFDLDLRTGPGRGWWSVLRLVLDEITRPSGLVERPGVVRHVEAVVLEGLLQAQPHNLTGLLLREEDRPGSAGTVARAVQLLRDRPAEAWTTARLATEVHLGVRALQEGFKRDLNTSPMGYLRIVRMHAAQVALLSSDPGTTSVREVAARHGFLHAGRFAAAYQRTYGELPSATLRRSS
ncbi:AraC family transcriptional regulator [Nocardioides flavescens]|uniref:Helix-turn-helix domain-containing protein n=1 Tax=Nocardioides flavescens TaxID=2691959 RepID=A0A6L7F3G6_9ACTN|nr:AraC family transcriptional regulator [Nocardioides flavescens]MXG91770.1 helix-turn-helix domain-containing protein [Nocardioides flavescens]